MDNNIKSILDKMDSFLGGLLQGATTSEKGVNLFFENGKSLSIRGVLDCRECLPEDFVGQNLLNFCPSTVRTKLETFYSMSMSFSSGKIQVESLESLDVT